jgi:hypothetical protein
MNVGQPRRRLHEKLGYAVEPITGTQPAGPPFQGGPAGAAFSG